MVRGLTRATIAFESFRAVLVLEDRPFHLNEIRACRLHGAKSAGITAETANCALLHKEERD